MAAGLAGSAAALGAAAAVDSFWPLVLLLALAGASGSSVNAASGRAVMGWFRPDERGFALGIRQTAIPIGGALAAVTLPWLASSGGVPWAFVALACGCVVGSLSGAIWLREPPREPAPLAEHARDPLRDRAMWLLSLGSWLYLVAQISTMTFVVLFLHVHRGVSTRHAGYVLAVTQVIAIAARIGAGRWSDRVGSRLRPLFLLGLALTGTMAAATAVVDAPLAVVVPVFVVAGVLGPLVERPLLHGRGGDGRHVAKRRRDRLPADGAGGGRRGRADPVRGHREPRLLALGLPARDGLLGARCAADRRAQRRSSRSRAITRKVGDPTGSSPNSGLTQPSSSARCS